MRLRPRFARGFTLVELSIVLVLVSILSATAAMMVRLPLAESQRQHGISQVRSMDALARLHARSGDKIELEFDRQDQSVRVLNLTKQETISQVLLDSNSRILSVAFGDSRASTRSTIAYDRFGVSKSFAVALGRHGSDPKWLLVLGMTGQQYIDESKEAVDAIIRRERNHSG
ncbi:hypothetical protein K227x_58500 [Rubripirellula lacrimiformis]|uniref:Prepilin-type N-terminal cleavage/methylation domain-containing protein n=1 Tax=Rubripirellula lacrimiformis TaxID=1930273 RepID=A0A517NK56_9BACT|nr:prepilin-type N-terminal cleavage/methylation domain-containing protein [Rubripirellula lacrimiformis]QDT07423.1 hypothetical protein K227x_58500 [Rubripirellula lacrimiformis]